MSLRAIIESDWLRKVLDGTWIPNNSTSHICQTELLRIDATFLCAIVVLGNSLMALGNFALECI